MEVKEGIQVVTEFYNRHVKDISHLKGADTLWSLSNWAKTAGDHCLADTGPRTDCGKYETTQDVPEWWIHDCRHRDDFLVVDYGLWDIFGTWDGKQARPFRNWIWKIKRKWIRLKFKSSRARGLAPAPNPSPSPFSSPVQLDSDLITSIRVR